MKIAADLYKNIKDQSGLVRRLIYQAANALANVKLTLYQRNSEGDGAFTTFVDETEDRIEQLGRVTLISTCAYLGNVIADGRIIQRRSFRCAFAKRRVQIHVALHASLRTVTLRFYGHSYNVVAISFLAKIDRARVRIRSVNTRGTWRTQRGITAQH